MSDGAFYIMRCADNSYYTAPHVLASINALQSTTLVRTAATQPHTVR